LKFRNEFEKDRNEQLKLDLFSKIKRISFTEKSYLSQLPSFCPLVFDNPIAHASRVVRVIANEQYCVVLNSAKLIRVDAFFVSNLNHFFLFGMAPVSKVGSPL
jgi:hypothetical protein